MSRRSISLMLAATVCVACAERSAEREPSARTLRDERMKMGTRFEIQVVSADEAAGRAAIDAAYAEIDRVEELLSEWRETSEISEVNRRAGRGPVGVGPDLFAVLQRALWASEVTDGAFDITFAGCGRLWSVRESRVPGDAEIESCLGRVDYRRLVLDADEASISVPRDDMRLGIAGIGKGYGVDRAAEVLEARGIEGYVVDGGGDIRLAGEKVDGAWTVGIADPRRPDRVWATLQPGGGAVVTSGDYQRYFELDGVRYHHILDPATGRPARRSVAVTVLAATAMDADALATGLFVLGPERGIELVEQLAGVEALIFGPDLAVHRSSGFPGISRNASR